MFMRIARNLFLTASIALLVSSRPAPADDDLQRVLHELDVAAANFRSTTADFEFDSIMTEPVPDKDVQTGTVYYERKGSAFQMAAHIKNENGKPAPKIYSYAAGVVSLDEEMIDQVTHFSRAGKWESYLILGFGASGKDLADKWDIKYLGPEKVNGTDTEKLELVAKDPTVRKNLTKVTIWVDPKRGVSLKQVFDQGEGQSRECYYSNIQVNGPLPGDAFKLKTDSKTQYVDR
jgi:outer membrane lipoprotein-sorting protein